MVSIVIVRIQLVDPVHILWVVDYAGEYLFPAEVCGYVRYKLEVACIR